MHQGYLGWVMPQQQMFCCTRRESHRGEIVTTLCQQLECVRGRNQLACSVCLQEEHQGHSLTSLARALPGLLEVDREREDHRLRLNMLTQFVCREFGEENQEGEVTNISNVVQRTVGLLTSLKQQADVNTEEMTKMKSIFKNLTRHNNQSPLKTSSPSRTEDVPLPVDSPQRSNPSSILSKGNQSVVSKFSQIQLLSNIPEVDCFSHTSKHPYLSISANLRTATKVSHSGHRFAAVGGKALGEKEREVRLRVDRSASGNIMIGVCHQSVVREKEFCNCYGINSGTYLIGQNGNSPTTAISFHHSIAVMNRKEIVGWNFQEGDTLLVGINFPGNYIYFRREAKRPSQEFSMKISLEDAKPELRALIVEGFKLVVLLQSEGDQVSIIEE